VYTSAATALRCPPGQSGDRRRRRGDRSLEDETALLARARALEPAALTAIHERYYDRIYRYAAFRVGDPAVAEDVTSEVFVRFLDAIRTGHAPDRTLRGWLYTVAARVVADHHRRQERHPEVSLNGVRSGWGDPVVLAERTLDWDALQEAMAELTEEQQEVIALRFGYGLSIHEVAEATGRSEGSVKQLQARAVARLARLLEGRLASL
jgi:RNA polymerase sigma-70 factor (ECF subfamily)